MFSVIRKSSLFYQIYADDIQLVLTLPFPRFSFLIEVLIRGLHLVSVSQSSTSLNSFNPIASSSTVHDHDVIIDSSLSFSNKICSVTRTCHIIFRALYRIKPFLDRSSAMKLVYLFILFNLLLKFSILSSSPVVLRTNI